MHIVYVLKSEKDGNLYIGCTSNIEKRLEMHNSRKVRSTKSRVPFVLIFCEKFENKYDAFNTEKFYKTVKGKKVLIKKL